MLKIDEQVDLTNGPQKIFAGILVALSLVTAYYLLPPLVTILKNIWIAILLAAPIVVIALNPEIVWHLYKQAAWNVTKALIKVDKLGYMYRYHEFILQKIVKLDESIQRITKSKVELKRSLTFVETELNNAMLKAERQTKQLEKEGLSESEIRNITLDRRGELSKIKINTDQREALVRDLEDMENKEGYLIEMSDLWKADADEMLYKLDSKAREHERQRIQAEAIGHAQEFLKGNSAQAKIFNESLRQIEDDISSYTANLITFDRKVQPILRNMADNQNVTADAGAQLLEEYKQKRLAISAE